jgi:hypothetical protein
VPAASARRFADGMRRVAPGPVAYAELPGGQHTFDLFHSIRFEAVVDAIDAFATCATGWREARGRSEARSAGRGRD